ncbi:hypothetical protein REB14_08535 [Chryseobacterium sp. ES2]|uniref:Uncharacterized protein n=1 Tax=Chryseobacterium metallicongregator TaxID=3073042 RepID=A0ABU1E3L4_9FLAO|nr:MULTISPECIES: hypothetical protein [Chryseobacterium]KYH04739.1 hypothetical protein A1704_15340 [Chryseobacterium cucumeris]MDR4952216.1 hypothetical protein [Chryseobacterium sp. ES2]
MKAYYYLLFRIYRYYKDKQNENEFEALFSATAVSTTLISINVITLIGLVGFFYNIQLIPSTKYIVLGILLTGILNHLLFVRAQKFLNYNFQKDKKGGVLIIAYIIISASFTFIVGNYNRKKIFEERKKNYPADQTGRPQSLQSEIENWFKEKK